MVATGSPPDSLAVSARNPGLRAGIFVHHGNGLGTKSTHRGSGRGVNNRENTILRGADAIRLSIFRSSMKFGSHNLVHPTTICTAIGLINSASVVGTPGIPPTGVNPMRLVAKRSGARTVFQSHLASHGPKARRPCGRPQLGCRAGHEDCVVSLPLPFSDLPDV